MKGLRTSQTSMASTPGVSGNVGRSGALSQGSASKKVSFRDGRRSEGDLSRVSSKGIGGEAKRPGLVDVAYYETLMHDKEPWEDPTFFPGFRDLYTADQLWLTDVSLCPCRPNGHWEVQNRDGVSIMWVEKQQENLMAWMKGTILRPFTSCRAPFVAKVRALQGNLLVTYRRRKHYCAKQLDILETFYGKESDAEYVGRVERTQHGYLIRDKDHQDIYRALEMSRRNSQEEEPRRRGHCHSEQKELKIFRTDSKEGVGRLVYVKRGRALGLLGPCLHHPEVGIHCNSDIGTNAKILLIGALLFLTHSGREKYVDWPLGSDAYGGHLEGPSVGSLDSTERSDESFIDTKKK